MKNTIIKVLSVVLVVVTSLTSAPLSGFVGLELPEWLDISIKSSAATSGTCGENLTWTLDESTGTLTISGTGAMYDYDYSNRPWESYEDNIKIVIIGDGVTTIGKDAFKGCQNLTNVTIGDSVTTIGKSSFSSCGLTSITIGESVTTIGEYAFKGCQNLTSFIVDANNKRYSSDEYGVLFNKDKTTLIQYPIRNNLISKYTIPDSVTTIGDSAFYYCWYHLMSVIIGDSVTTIGDNAFAHCDSLVSVTIGDGVTTIGDYAFYSCDNLKNILVDSNNQYYSNDEYGVLFDKDKTVLIQYPTGNNRTTCIIPDSVSTVGDYAFYSCESLTSVTIGDSVTTIGDNAFADCDSLASVTIPDSVIIIDKYAFLSCESLTSVTIGDSVTTIGNGAFEACTSLTRVTIPDNVIIIDKYAFSNCESLTSVTIGDSVTTIGNGAFSDCESLTSVTIPDSVKTIGHYAFYSCRNLTSVTIGDSVTTIGICAFLSCKSLTSVTIGDSVTTISDSAFSDCIRLTDVYYSGTEVKWTKISIESSNGDLITATIHYNSTDGNIPSDFVFEDSDYTQTHVVSDYSSKYDKYESMYFDGFGKAMDGTDGNADLCVPGLTKADDMIPQGVAYYPEKDWIFVSSYTKDKDKPSVIYALDKSTGKYVAQFDVYTNDKDSDGNTQILEFTGKLGGIAVSNNNLYLSNGKSISYIPLSEFDVAIGTVKQVYIAGKQSLSSQLDEASVSYVSFNDGVLYTGNFYNNSKEYKKPATSSYNSIVIGYALSGSTSADEWFNFKAMSNNPTYTYFIPNHLMEIQGATVKDGCLYLSSSYGRQNDSNLYAINVGNNTNVVADDVLYSCSAPPMMEGITLVDTELYTVFESGAYFYRDKNLLNKAKRPTDVLWKIDYNALLNKNEGAISDVENATISYKEGSVEISFKQNWFGNDSLSYNHSLAQLSSQFIMLGYDYPALEDALETIGMSGIQMEAVAEEDKVDYFIANKKISVNGEEFTLIFTGFIGTNTVQWNSNFNPGLNPTHQSFNSAKNYVLDKLYTYISQLAVDKAKTKILVCGHSRGAATANLVSSQLIKDENLAFKENIYTYTFATPNPTSLPEKNNEEFDRIFNIVNPEDFVTKCMSTAWGFGRYGMTYTLPSKTNTSANKYNVYLNKVKTYYSRFTNGDEYEPYSTGEEATYIVVKNLTGSIKNLHDFYTKELEAGIIGDITPYVFFQIALCPFVNKIAGIDDYTAAIAAIASIEASSSKVYKSIVNYFIKDQMLNSAFTEAHCAETYCAYMMSLTSNQVTQYRTGYKNTVNCPVDIEVYDKTTSELVGRIVDNVIDEEIATKDNSIVMSVDGDSKSFWLPSDGEYEVKLIGNDDGTMDYTVAEVNGDSIETARVNFNDVEIVDNKSMFGDFIGEDFALENYSLTTEDGMTIKNDDLITSENADEFKFDVTISTEGVGFATGDGTFTKGDYVTVLASPEESSTFVGWYEKGELVSTDVKYGFVVQNDVELIAKFKCSHISIEIINIVEPTCILPGYKGDVNCTECGEIIESLGELPAIGHNYNSIVTVPTCTEKGYTTYICSVCGDTYFADEVSALGHTEEEISAVEPTCTETGLTTGVKCSVCNEILESQQEVPALGHDIIIDDSVSPDCTNTGLTVGEHCSRCDYKVEQIVVDALGHKYDSVITAPTCTSQGYTTYTCHCGDTYTGDYVDSLAHNYKDGICTDCGTPDPSYFTFEIQEPSRTTIRFNDGIKLHTKITGKLPDGSRIEWTKNNNNFNMTTLASGNEITIISKNNGYTTFTATVYDADNNVIAQDTIEMYSKAGFFDKIGGFFRSLFGLTRIYEK